jgi:hypothetical protein
MVFRNLSLGFAATFAALLYCPIKNDLLAATSNAQWTELREVQLVPEFVCQAELPQFRLAVDEASKVSQTARRAAEALSAKFADEVSRPALEEAPKTIETKLVAAVVSEDVHPLLWLAALSVGVDPPVQNAKPSLSTHVAQTKSLARQGARKTSLSKNSRRQMLRFGYRETQQTKSVRQNGPGMKRVAWSSYSARSD